MDNVSTMPPRGKTYFDGTTPPTSANYAETADLEGILARFDDVDPSNTDQRRSGRQVTCRFVRNVATITLAPKRLVTWKAGYRGERVDGYCTTELQECAGVVDEMYATGIPANDLGWIVVAGPCNVLTSLAGDGENVIAEGDILTALTAATSQATTAGRFQNLPASWTATQATDGTATNAIANAIGRAMSAKTTANTNVGCLVDVAILKAGS